MIALRSAVLLRSILYLVSERPVKGTTNTSLEQRKQVRTIKLSGQENLNKKGFRNAKKPPKCKVIQQ